MKELDIIRQTRHNFLKLIESLSIEQLNIIPPNGRNNIAWNFGHIIATQQVLCYVKSGTNVKIEQWIIDKYQKGTRPESSISTDEINGLKELLFSSVKELEQDLAKGVFNAFEPFKTQYGVELETINDIVKFVSIHESMHYGVALTIKNFV